MLRLPGASKWLVVTKLSTNQHLARAISLPHCLHMYKEY
jgi:hypothetical protein